MTKHGAKIWYFVDGYLPEKIGSGPMEAHEALMILNPNAAAATVLLDFYFENKDPVKGIEVIVGAERVRALRLDHPGDIGGLKIPSLTQYSLRLRSDVDVVAQFGRLDTTQINMAYYSCAGFCTSSENNEANK
ncbi:MAG: hypothetical protein JSS95_15515 [Acidobacteria bacterium]|nr:hypothetical protein [Acidobacteriota bacterium]